MIPVIGAEKRNRHFLVGYDLGEEYSQISFCTPNEPNPETLPVVPGTEQYNIPTVVCKRFGANQWFFGKEAQRRAAAGEGELVDHLVSRACSGDRVEIEGRVYEVGALLTIFVKRSFGLFYSIAPQTVTDVLVITTESLNSHMVEVLERVVEGMDLHSGNIFFQSYEESFYEFMIHQPTELWLGRTVLFDYRGGSFTSMSLEFNRQTIPVVGTVETEKIEGFPEREVSEDGKILNDRELDQALLKTADREFNGLRVSSCYCIGDGFSGGWMQTSLRAMCQDGRRIFQGNNLYSKGAAYVAYQKQYPEEEGRRYLFLGRSKVKTNVSIQAREGDTLTYVPILDAGVNWYDVENQTEMYLEGENSVSLLITPLSPGRSAAREHMERVVLEGLPERPPMTTRVRMTVYMQDVEHMVLETEDLGFGEIFPASHRIWRNVIDLS